MRINPLQNISFKYNKQYHDEVKKYLNSRKRNQEVAQTLLHADEFLMEFEDRIIEMEKNKKNLSSSKYNDMSEMFCDFKRDLAYYFACYFPKLKYADNEITQYLNEYNENPIQDRDLSWRISLAVDIQSFATQDHEGINTKNKETEKEKPVKNISDEVIPALQELATAKAKNDTSSKLLSLFEPLASSPVGFSSVVGMDDLKTKFQESILDYIVNPELARKDYEEYGIKTPRGFLLYGPPGCGKTFIAQALAQEASMKMFSLDVSKVGSIYVNETANNIENAFNYVTEVAKKEDRPVILFLDEFDSLGISRDGGHSSCNEDLKATDTLLKHLQNAQDNNIIIIAATNRYDLLDDAIAQRFDESQYIGLPDQQQRLNLIISELSKRKKAYNLLKEKDNLDKIATELSGFSMRSIVFILNQAVKNAKHDNRSDIKYSHIIDAIRTTDQQKVNEEKYKKVKNSKIGFSV